MIIALPSGLFYLLIMLGFVRVYSLPTAAMEPAVHMGDRFIVEAISSASRNPKRGDIIVFRSDGVSGLQPGSIYIKRIAGLPGEQLKIEDGKLFVNGAVTEIPNAHDLPPIDQKIPAGHYFVVGDNPTNSVDSRSWGTLPQTNIIGRAVYRYFPVQSMGPLR